MFEKKLSHGYSRLSSVESTNLDLCLFLLHVSGLSPPLPSLSSLLVFFFFFFFFFFLNYFFTFYLFLYLVLVLVFVLYVLVLHLALLTLL